MHLKAYRDRIQFSASHVWSYLILLPTVSEERGVLGVGSIPVAILPSCEEVKTIPSYYININTVG